MAKCAVCGKTTAFGNRVSHSKHATKRKFRPNLQRTTVIVGGRSQQVVVCTKCLKKGHLLP